MTATDELRGGLRERGVQYQACGDSFTMWKHDGKTATYAEYPEGGKLKAFITPKQAIATTVGRETCREVEDKDTGFIVCSECGAVHDVDYTSYYCWCCGRKVVDDA